MRITLAGGHGFIGRWLAAELEQHGHHVWVVDRKNGKSHDLRTRLGLRLIPENTDVVVHLAAQVGRLAGEDSPQVTIDSNALMSTLVAQRTAAIGARLVYTSTSEIYGDQGNHTCTEDTPTRLPHNLYGLSKHWGEQVSALYISPGGLQVLRPSMPFGPGLPAGRGRAAIVNMLDQASRGEAIPVHRDSRRCWCWIGDTVRGIRQVIEDGEVAYHADDWALGYGAYNIGRDDNEQTMQEVAEYAILIAGHGRHVLDQPHVELVDAPANQTVVKRLSSEKLRGLGWQPRVSVYSGMVETWRAMQHPNYPQEETWTSLI